MGLGLGVGVRVGEGARVGERMCVRVGEDMGERLGGVDASNCVYVSVT